MAIVLLSQVSAVSSQVEVQEYNYDLYCVEEPEECPSCIPEGAVIVDLLGDDLHTAVAEALASDLVKTLRAVLLDDGVTPRVDLAFGYAVVQEETGFVNGLSVVIPFEGEVEFAFIFYFHCLLKGFEDAAANVGYRCGDQVDMKYYMFDDEGKVYLTLLHDHSCTYDCVAECCAYYGISTLLATASCIAACIGCALGGLPACIICGACAGIVLGCAVVCCV